MVSHRVDLIPPVLNCHMLSIREFIADSVSKVFIRGWLDKYLLLSMHENFRLPEEKEFFSINCIVCIF